jgi:uncharacterized protein (DUF1778 family)
VSSSLPRITARVDVDTQNLLSQAAAIAGMPSLNAFVVSAAIEKAQQIIERDQILKLSQRDAMMLIEALDAPAKVHTRLQQAARRYDSKTQS